MPFSLIGGAADLVGGGLGALFGTAAEAAPEVVAADALGAGAGDVLAADVGAGALAGDVGAGATAADLGAGAVGAGADLAGAGTAAADLGALGGAGAATAANFAGAVPAIDALGFAAPVGADVAPNAAAIAGATNTGALSALPATLGGGAESAGGIVPASAALPLPGSPTDILDLSGQNLAGLTAPSGQQFASLGTGTMNDASEIIPWEASPNTNLAATSTAPPTDTGTPQIPGTLGNAMPTDLTGQSAMNTMPGDLTPVTSTSPATGGGAPAAGTSTTPGLQGAGGGGGGTGSTGGGFDWWKAAGLGLAAAPLAITLARGQQQMPQQGQQSQAISSAVGGAGTQLLNQAMQGQVTPGQQASLTFNRQAMINQARQAMYNQGVQNPEASSAWGGIVADIDNKIAIQQQQFLTANIEEAFKGTGQAQTNLTQLASQQVALDNAYQQAIANAGRSLGSVVGQAGTRLL